MEKKVKSLVHDGETLYLREVLFRCPERGFVVLDTQKKDFNVWVFDTSIQEKDFFLTNQRTALTQMQDNPHVIDLFEEVIVDKTTVCLITERVERESLATIITEKPMIDHEIFSLGIAICKVMIHLHDSHRLANFINPEYIFLDKAAGFKFVNFTLSFDREQVEINNKEIVQSKLFSINRTVQILGYTDNIHKEDDLLCLGLLLYHLCYGNLDIKKHPEDQNKIIFEEKPKHAFGIQSVIEGCLLPHKTQRISPEDILLDFENEQRLDLPENIGSNDSTIMANISLQELTLRDKTPKNEFQKPGLMSSLSKMITVATTETEGWLMSYIIEDSTAPNDDFVNKTLEKFWRKRHKVKKLYDIIDRLTDDKVKLRNSLIMAKLLSFIHGVILKGPPEIISLPLCEKIKKSKTYNSELSYCSYLNYLLLKVRNQWEHIAKGAIKDKYDKQRTQAFSYIIYFYSLVLTEKSKFGLDYQNTFAGNFSIEPLTRLQDVKIIFSQKTLVDLNSYCSTFLRFFKLLSDDIGVRAIQFCIIKNMATELNNALGISCYFIATYKRIVFSIEGVDKEKMTKLVEFLESSLDNCIIRFHYTLEDMKHSSSFKIYSELLPYSSLSAVTELKSIAPLEKQIETFEISEYLPLNEFIGSFTIPKPYGINTQRKELSKDEKVLMIKREVLKDSKLSLGRPLPSSTFISPKQIRGQVFDKQVANQSMQLHQKPLLILTQNSPDKSTAPDMFQNRKPDELKKSFMQPKLVQSNNDPDQKNPYMSLDDEVDDHKKYDIPVKMRLVVSRDRSVSHSPSPIPSPSQKEEEERDLAPKKIDVHINERNHLAIPSRANLVDKKYNAFDDSDDSGHIELAKCPLLNEKGEPLAFDAGNSPDQEFLNLIPLSMPHPQLSPPMVKEDKGVQCDFDLPDIAERKRSSSAEFDLQLFMKDEIASGILIFYLDIQDWIVKYADLKFEREIANGSTCTVYQGEYRGLAVGKMGMTF